MANIFVTHASAGQHQTPDGHPEQAARYSAVMTACQPHVADFWQADSAPQASYEQLCLVHSPAYVDSLLKQIDANAFLDLNPTERLVQIDTDTYAGPNSLDAAMRGVGGACHLVDKVMSSGDIGFSAMRPPGHHAEPEKAMGFCLFASAAIAARHAQVAHGAERVAVLDFDVHHGNGTQAAFWDIADLFYASSHQMPLYPGTGEASETGAHDNIFNLPVLAGASGTDVLQGWRNHLLPAVANARPDLIIISAGFDAHKDDPLGGLMLSTEDFAQLTFDIISTAQDCCDGRIVSVLEGGYNLEALGASVLAHLKALAARESASP